MKLKQPSRFGTNAFVFYPSAFRLDIQSEGYKRTELLSRVVADVSNQPFKRRIVR